MGTTGLVNSEAEMLAFRSERAVWPGERGAMIGAKADNPPYSGRMLFSDT